MWKAQYTPSPQLELEQHHLMLPNKKELRKRISQSKPLKKKIPDTEIELYSNHENMSSPIY